MHLSPHSWTLFFFYPACYRDCGLIYPVDMALQVWPYKSFWPTGLDDSISARLAL